MGIAPVAAGARGTERPPNVRRPEGPPTKPTATLVDIVGGLRAPFTLKVAGTRHTCRWAGLIKFGDPIGARDVVGTPRDHELPRHRISDASIYVYAPDLRCCLRFTTTNAPSGRITLLWDAPPHDANLRAL